MQLLVAILLSLLAVAMAKSEPKVPFAPLSEEIIDYINNHPLSTWKAGRSSRFKTIEEAKTLLGGRMETQEQREHRRTTQRHQVPNTFIPAEFDARHKWKTCRIISEIWDQSACGSCWAFGAVSAMSDRMCILTGRTVKLSARDLISCCRETCGYGCEGGWAGPAWDYWRDNGLVTGGSKEENSGCLPYPFPAKTHGKQIEPFATPDCLRECKPDYPTKYLDDKIYGAISYNVPNDMEQIQLEIMTYGPVEACFNVYEDFLYYKTGVYSHQYGELAGGHCVRIIGWGVDGAYPYWLIANSWNNVWGEKGLARMLRGYNECGIEGNVVAGKPFKPVSM